MNRFMLFMFDAYYPAGGMNDYQESFNTVEECQIKFDLSSYEYGQVFDTKKLEWFDLKFRSLLNEPTK